MGKRGNLKPGTSSTPTQGKKKFTRKLKARKLEDRIAPGMIGGGIVDPGSADLFADADVDQQDASLNETDATEVESVGADAPESPEQGQFQEEQDRFLSSQGDTDADADGDDSDSALSQDAQDLADSDGDADYVEETPTWREADWVSENADGSIHVTPPEGVSISDGIATFSADAANEALPLPEDTYIRYNGAVQFMLPESAEYSADTGHVNLPADSVSVDAIPEAIPHFENIDGSITVALPSDGVEYNEQDHSITLSNETVNEIVPSYVQVNPDGSVAVELPEDTTYNDDGSLDLSASGAASLDNPLPDSIGDLDFATPNLDGSVSFEFPDGVDLDIDLGVVNFPHGVAVSNLPFPDGVTLNGDGTLDIGLPQGAEYDADSNSAVLPPESLSLNDIPSGVDAHYNPDGSITATLPDGMEYNPDTNSIHVDNYWANEITPDTVAINEDGSVSVQLPEETDYSAAGEGEITVAADDVSFIDRPAPDFVHDVEFSEVEPDGSYTFTPPAEMTVSEGTLEIPHEAVADHVPMPEGVTLNSDGSMDVAVPEGTTYDADAGSLTFAAGEVHLDDIPPGVMTQVNLDGSITATLPEGTSYNAADGTVHLDNYWSNELAPDGVEITEAGGLSVALPSTTEYAEGSDSFTVPMESADFVMNPEPAYVASGPDWVEANPDGSVSALPPESVTVNADEGTVSLPAAVVAQEFPELLPEGVTLGADGTMEVELPEGTQFNAEEQLLTLPAGEIHVAEIPAGIEAEVNPDGSVSALVPDGITYDAASNTVTLDNFWVNEVTPTGVEVSDAGVVTVSLPSDTQYLDSGAITIPADSADFIESPAPEYVAEGPEWLEEQPDGAITVAPPEGVQVDSDAGTVSLPAELVNEQFDGYLPEEVTLNADGTATVALPEDTEFNPETGTLILPAGEVHTAEIPEGISGEIQDDGSLAITLPDGISYDAAANTVTLDNFWVNEVAPDAVEVSEAGVVTVSLPSDTQYFDDGSLTISAASADFMEQPIPEVVASGPDWVDQRPDGSLLIETPESVEVDTELMTATIPVEVINEQFSGLLPEGASLNGDGSMTVAVPQGTTFNAEEGSITLPAGTVHTAELPDIVEATVNSDGSITAQLPEGVTFNASAGTVQVSNEVVQDLAPVNVQVTTQGQVIVELPLQTQAGSQGELLVPAAVVEEVLPPAPQVVYETFDDEEDRKDDKEVASLDTKLEKHWSKIEAKADHMLDRWESYLKQGKLPSNIEASWDALDAKADRWFDRFEGSKTFATADTNWKALEARAENVLSQWRQMSGKMTGKMAA